MRHLLLAAMLLGSAVKPAEVAGPLAIEVSVFPSSTDRYQLLKRQTPETYTCSVIVTDAKSKKLIGDANLIASPGKMEMISRDHGTYTVEFSVKISAGSISNHADTHVVVSSAGNVVLDQRNKIALLFAPPGNIPLR